ncbi:class I SAM-dependent methyltransferase [Actinokineospora sp. UTMC 2448]|uniref:class I SAM-dependent methyltransferase n=1 Tax=Actinokineospora sp. UTMC 2448 TaxID=2268449 RepID=UPI002164386F|nr:class I SAM-dependent methyltransferase [Actinokineospora sp. UTMC 2448]UVS77029.1 Methyltransferase domain protein [Actinokineospora sp. UTMC 2448]
MSFEALLAEAAAVPTEGWDFSWFDGRATEERPPWRYSALLADRLSRATAAADLQTGGGEVVSEARRRPRLLFATETWPPNVHVARHNLPDALVVQVAEGACLPFRAESLDLVTSRHPTHTPWPEVIRVLRPGGTVLTQQIGAGTNRELSEFFLGSLPPPPSTTDHLRRALAPLDVITLREATLRVEFFDVAAVAHFLRKVIWTVPDFTIPRYRDRLRDMHDHITATGSFLSHSRRVLVEARKPQ